MAHRSDFDSAWKDALDAYFPQFMALLWPALHAQIDWRRPPEFLDKELQALLRSRARGRRHVDKLVSVRLLGGQDALVLIHVEIQSGHDSGFAQRMFAYHVRLREKRPRQPVVGLAVLTGEPGKRRPGHIRSPDNPASAQAAAPSRREAAVAWGESALSSQDNVSYAYGCWGCELHFTFPVVRLETWRARQAELLALAPHNPFAVVILAQLEADATRDAAQRLVRKTALVRRLYHWGFSRDNVVQLFRIIDAMVGLPEAMEPEFEDTVIQIEGEMQMAYVTSIERVQLRRERQQGVEEGKQEGQHEQAVNVLEALIARKFGNLPDWAGTRIAQADAATLNRWILQILDAQHIEDVFA